MIKNIGETLLDGESSLVSGWGMCIDDHERVYNDMIWVKRV